MKIPRLSSLVLVFTTLTYALPAAAADAVKDYPNKPIRFIVPFGPGGGTDTTTRIIAKKLSEMWRKQAIVENRTGAAGAIGVELTAAAVPDGYTVCLISASHSVDSATNSKLSYDLTKDLQGITQATALFYVMTVNPSVPAKSVSELIEYSNANPGKLNFGSSGTGGLEHLAGEMFGYMAGLKLAHIPYKGGAASVAAAASGETQIGFTTMTSVRPHMAAGRVRAMAITAGKRSPAMPELPTVSEAGVPGYEVNQWYGYVTSAKVSLPIVAKLSEGIAVALKDPGVAQRLGADGSTPVGTTPDQFSAHIKSEIAKWHKLVNDAGLRLH